MPPKNGANRRIDTPRVSPSPQADPSPKDASVPEAIFKSFLVISFVSLSNIASQLALHPLYGGTTTSLHFPNISLAACILSSVISTQLNTFISFAFMSIILASSPWTLHVVGSYTSAWVDPVWGPLTTHLVSAFPMILLCAGLAQKWIHSVIPRSAHGVSVKAASGLFCWFAISRADQVVWDHLPTVGKWNSCNAYIFLTLGAALISGFLSLKHVANRRQAGPAPTRRNALYNPAFVSGIFLFMPILISIRSQTRAPCTTPNFPYIDANNTVRILAREHSTTGLVVIGEYLEGPFRFMRCDQSLLGGKWLVDPNDLENPRPGRNENATELTESIYSAFLLQEAVRLVERESPRLAAGQQQRVLNIGLGVGIAAQSFIQHGLDLTIIEIDPAVYNYARKFFGLDAPASVYLEDARQWVHQRASKIQAADGLHADVDDRFDFIVHDCFSGGAVPNHIFTQEFWNELKVLLDSNGVLAVNFAGYIESNAAHGILSTLLTIFPQCRIFHDHYPPEDALTQNEFLNMVFFCTPSTDPFTFRAGVKEDFHGSFYRSYILSNLEAREIPVDRIIGIDPTNVTSEAEKEWILTDKNNPLGEWQRGSAVEHWKVMQTLFPHSVWTTY